MKINISGEAAKLKPMILCLMVNKASGNRGLLNQVEAEEILKSNPVLVESVKDIDININFNSEEIDLSVFEGKYPEVKEALHDSLRLICKDRIIEGNVAFVETEKENIPSQSLEPVDKSTAQFTTAELIELAHNQLRSNGEIVPHLLEQLINAGIDPVIFYEYDTAVKDPDTLPLPTFPTSEKDGRLRPFLQHEEAVEKSGRLNPVAFLDVATPSLPASESFMPGAFTASGSNHNKPQASGASRTKIDLDGLVLFALQQQENKGSVDRAIIKKLQDAEVDLESLGIDYVVADSSVNNIGRPFISLGAESFIPVGLHTLVDDPSPIPASGPRGYAKVSGNDTDTLTLKALEQMEERGCVDLSIIEQLEKHKVDLKGLGIVVEERASSRPKKVVVENIDELIAKAIKQNEEQKYIDPSTLKILKKAGCDLESIMVPYIKVNELILLALEYQETHNGTIDTKTLNDLEALGVNLSKFVFFE